MNEDAMKRQAPHSDRSRGRRPGRRGVRADAALPAADEAQIVTRRSGVTRQSLVRHIVRVD